MEVKCICVDDKSKPEIIPESLWVKEKETYVITHIYNQINQPGIKGCIIKGKDLSAYVPYNCFRLDRFAFTKEELLKLVEMLKECTELNDIQISEITEILEKAVEHETAETI